MNSGKTLFAQLIDFCRGSRSPGLSRDTVAISGCGRCPAPSTIGPWHSRS